MGLTTNVPKGPVRGDRMFCAGISVTLTKITESHTYNWGVSCYINCTFIKLLKKKVVFKEEKD